jgi:hypothetical protein
MFPVLISIYDELSSEQNNNPCRFELWATQIVNETDCVMLTKPSFTPSASFVGTSLKRQCHQPNVEGSGSQTSVRFKGLIEKICDRHGQGRPWMRVEASITHGGRREARLHMMEENPNLNSLYTGDDGRMEVLYLKDATATLYSGNTKPKSVQF